MVGRKYLEILNAEQSTFSFWPQNMVCFVVKTGISIEKKIISSVLKSVSLSLFSLLKE